MKTNRDFESRHSKTFARRADPIRDRADSTDAIEILREQQRDPYYLINMRTRLLEGVVSGILDPTFSSNSLHPTRIKLRQRERQEKRRARAKASLTIGSGLNSPTKICCPGITSPCAFLFGGIEQACDDYFYSEADSSALDVFVHHPHAEK